MRVLWVPILLLFTLVPSSANSQVKSRNDCWKTANTTVAMHRCADEDARQADGELNRTYQELLNKAKNDGKAIAKIKAAERAWIAYRDAQLAAIFPHDNKQEYGSMYSICYLQIATELTKARSQELRRMLDHWGDEGAGCYY